MILILSEINKVLARIVIILLLLFPIHSFCQLSDKISLYDIIGEFSDCEINKDASLLVFSGGRHFTGNSEEKVVLIDLNKKEKISSYKYDRPFKARRVAISPDNSKIACSVYDDTYSSGTVYKILVWDRYTGKLICEKKVKKLTDNISFSSDSKYLAYDDTDKKIKIVDVYSSKLKNELELGVDKDYTFDKNWNYVAYISNESTINIWNVNNNAKEKSIECKGCIIDKIEYSYDGKYILCLTKKTLRVYEAKSGILVLSKQAPEDKNGCYYTLSSFFSMSKSNSLFLYQISKENAKEKNNKYEHTIYFHSFIKNNTVDSIKGVFNYAFFSNDDNKAILVSSNEINIYRIVRYTDKNQIYAYDKAKNGNIDDCRSYLKQYPKGEYVEEIKTDMIKKEKAAYEKALSGNNSDCSTYLTQYPEGKYVSEVKTEMIKKENTAYELALNGKISDCSNYLKEYPNGKYLTQVSNAKSEREQYEKAKKGTVEDCNSYISKYPTGKYINEVKNIINNKDQEAYLKAKSGNSVDCSNYISRFSNGKYIKEVVILKNEKLAYEKAVGGTVNDCNTYIAQYPAGQYTKEVLLLKNDKLQDIKNAEAKKQADLKKEAEKNAYEKALNGSVSDCNNYLTKYPNGEYLNQVNSLKQEKQNKIKKDNLFTINSNKANWKMGNKLCKETTNGIICGTLNQWNEDKSMAQIKIVTSPGGTYEGESLSKGNLIWIAASGKAWHICFDDEITKSVSNDKSNIITNSSNNSSSTTNSKYDVGDFVYFCQAAHDHSGWMFMRRDFTAMIKGVIEELNSNKTKAKVKVVKCYECASMGTFNGQTVYEGSEIWVDIYSWDKYPCNTK